MDKFLEVVCETQITLDGENADKVYEIFKPFTDRMKSIVSEELYGELDNIFSCCAAESSRFYAVEGMKLAIGIMDGTYITTV